MDRTQIIERLLLGRMVEAEATNSEQSQRTFVEVRPLLDRKLASVSTAEFGVEPQLRRSSPNINAVAGYRVRTCTLNSGWEEYPDDWDRYLHQQELFECASLEELELLLSDRFGLKLAEFKLPGTTESPL